MLTTIRNAWRVPEIRKKIVFTLIMLLFFRLLSFIPVPGISGMGDAIKNSGIGFFDIMTLVSGSSLSQFTMMGLGISPYINASIIMQLLTVVVPKWAAWQKEGGEEGRKKINKITRFGSIGLAAVMASVFLIGFSGSEGVEIDPSFGWFAYVVVVITLTAGSAIALWIGEKITEKGIGNGVSLLIFAGIVARFPSSIFDYIKAMFGEGASEYFIKVPLILIGIVLLITFIVFMDNGERRIPVQYAKRNVGRKLYGGQSTHIPIKVNSSGVMPLIFAMAFLSFPSTVLVFARNSTGFWNSLYNFFNTYLVSTNWVYYVLMAVLVMGFAYFYSSITFDPIEMSKNLQQYGGFIPGIRPGKPTSDFIKRINVRIVFIGALFLTFIAVVPSLFTLIFSENFALGATSVLIAVSVSLETSRQLESLMLMRHYKGFLND